jgi:hypothetical protein
MPEIKTKPPVHALRRLLAYVEQEERTYRADLGAEIDHTYYGALTDVQSVREWLKAVVEE